MQGGEDMMDVGEEEKVRIMRNWERLMRRSVWNIYFPSSRLQKTLLTI